jgi:hypothetical protein
MVDPTVDHAPTAAGEIVGWGAAGLTGDEKWMVIGALGAMLVAPAAGVMVVTDGRTAGSVVVGAGAVVLVAPWVSASTAPRWLVAAAPAGAVVVALAEGRCPTA